jgi:hypothetical protein
MERRTGPNSTRQYSEMTDDQLRTSRHGLLSESREWSVVNQEIEDRAARRREDRNF